ncbi:MAG: SUF system NifU family Fe-S cluster assembly protein [Bifidobacteriaceae bacterium]|jgi:nitrogen fixation NifU-like protein|nr:SUF system NifU family Fe-S cluster assembly protein [Bifidobacteriaceae bacterium]
MSSLDLMYQDLILDHARHPHGKGLADAFDGESFQVNPTCGDRIQLRVSLAAGPVLAALTWDGQGCSISQASASMMRDLVEGKTLAEVADLGEAFGALMHSRGRGLDQARADALEDAIALEGVSRYPMRVKCALLGWMALKDAVAKAAAGDASPAHIPEGI